MQIIINFSWLTLIMFITKTLRKQDIQFCQLFWNSINVVEYASNQ